MAVSGKYGTIEIPNIGEKEPVFILRAQDKLAEYAIEMYRAMATSHASRVVETINVEIEQFRSWAGKKKIPD